VIEIEADANNEGSACTYRTNTSYINAADATDDSATETVECEGEPTLDKKQQNLTDNGWMTDSRITVDEEDVIQYEVFFGNIGADLDNVYVIDYLPEEVVIADL
jgi:uncharacterized repeat protein (TIGR01451 family)